MPRQCLNKLRSSRLTTKRGKNMLIWTHQHDLAVPKPHKVNPILTVDTRLNLEILALDG